MAVMNRMYSWHLWPARNWPADASEEARFAQDLAARAQGPGRSPDRGAVTAVVNALRCGATAGELLGYLPGARPADLLAAYDHVEERRRLAADAWARIAESPRADVLAEHADAAARLLPVPVRALVTAATCLADPTAVLEQIADRLRARIQECRDRASDTEAELARHTPPSPAAVETGRTLYDPHRPGLWADGYFLPARVGELTPVRLADVLGERPHRPVLPDLSAAAAGYAGSAGRRP
jgi:hypothetical protein